MEIFSSPEMIENLCCAYYRCSKGSVHHSGFRASALSFPAALPLVCLWMAPCSACKLMCIPARAAQFTDVFTGNLNGLRALWVPWWWQNALLTIIPYFLDFPTGIIRHPSLPLLAHHLVFGMAGVCAGLSSVPTFTGTKCKTTWLHRPIFLMHCWSISAIFTFAEG